jgi:rhodanese-related sulfurtransferase
LSYVVTGDDGDRAAFSGGSLLFGTVGRTDLFGAELTDTLSRAQHRSARQLANAVSPTTPLHPTHGFGSLCASTQVHRDASTIADQLEENIALLIDDEDEFVTRLIDGFGSYPGYYAHLGAINRAGPAPIDLRPMPALAAQELVNRLDHGALVVDLRPRRSFAADHVLGTVNVEMADPFAMYVGWLWPDQPVTMVCDSQDEATDAQLALARIGVDRPAGVAYHSALRHMHLPRARVHVAGFADLARARQRGPLTVLDVRRHDEVVRARLEGSCHVELPSIPALATRRGRSPRRMWVHCASGYRAAIACSVLHAAGHDVVLIDDRLDQADAAGCEVLTDLA